jgi:hypothetical protein
MGLAPNAPSPYPNQRSAVPAYPSTAPSERLNATGGMYRSRPLERENLPSTLDFVTIALAVLAFLAVACLIPLYIAVFQARFGG